MPGPVIAAASWREDPRLVPGTPLTRDGGPGLLWASVAHLKDLKRVLLSWCRVDAAGLLPLPPSNGQTPPPLHWGGALPFSPFA